MPLLELAPKSSRPWLECDISTGGEKHLIVGGPLGRGLSIQVTVRHVVAAALAPRAGAVAAPFALPALHLVLRRHQTLHAGDYGQAPYQAIPLVASLRRHKLSLNRVKRDTLMLLVSPEHGVP